ncbi:MAG: hydrolase [marine bacterium B5-7]|nr:MAG: hydrolase [marine bacterium B5-7]
MTHTMSREFLSLVNGRVEVERFNVDAPGPTLVFLHEGLGCVSLWKDFPQLIASASGLDTLVYSRFGYGASDPVELPRPLSYMHDEALDILPMVLDAAGIRRCILIGHSDGASIALIAAGGTGDARIEGLVLMAPHVFTEPDGLASIDSARQAFERGLRDRLKKYHGDNVDCAFRGWNDAWLDPGFVNWNLEEYLPAIRVPSLIIQGRDDEYGTLRQVDAIVSQSGGPVDTLILDNCGHSPQRDQPGATSEAIFRFLATVTTQTPHVELATQQSF